MAIDEKTKKLVFEISSIEKNLIEDEAIMQATIRAFELLEIIFQDEDENIVKKLKDQLKEVHGQNLWLKRFLSIKKTRRKKSKRNFRRLVFPADIHAVNLGSTINIYRANILYRFLSDSGLGEDLKKLERVAAALGKHVNNQVDILDSKIYEDKPKSVRRAISIFLSILRKNRGVLEEHKDRIIHDLDYEFSIINLIVHEVTHSLWESSVSKSGKIIYDFYNHGIDESWASVIQVLAYLYDPKEEVNEASLNKAIDKVLRIIETKSKINAYNISRREQVQEIMGGDIPEHLKKAIYCFDDITKFDTIKFCTLLIGALVLCDVILKQEDCKDRPNLRRIIKSLDIHFMYKECLLYLKKIRNRRLAVLIKKRLIKKIPECNEKVIAALLQRCNRTLEQFPKYKLSEIVEEIEIFMKRVNILSVLGEHRRCNSLKKKLQKAIKEYFENIKDEEREKVSKEESLIDTIVQILSKDDEEFSISLRGLFELK